MFEKRLIGAYCHLLYDFKERQRLLLCQGRIKANSAGKNFNVILIRKQAHQIVEHAYHQTAYFFMSQNDHPLGYAINFDYVSSPPLYTFKNCKWQFVSSLFLFEYFQSSLINQHDYHYMHRSYGLYLVKHFLRL